MVSYSNLAVYAFDSIDVCNRPLDIEAGDSTLTIAYKQMWNAGGGKFDANFECNFERTNTSNQVETIRYYIPSQIGEFKYNDGITGLWIYQVSNHQVIAP